MTNKRDALLVLNAGSSSLKFRLFGLAPDLPYLLGGKVAGIGTSPIFQAHWQEDSRDETVSLPRDSDIETALSFVLDWLGRQPVTWSVEGAVHRIVNGGPNRDHAVKLDLQTLQNLETYSALAPQHQPHNLAAVKALWKSQPKLRQFGCFDTAFHAHHDALATELALPVEFRNQGVRRYGYHGLSYSWIARRLKCDHPQLAGGRVVAAHLGNGASLCAIKDGLSVDTTMSFTALDGLPMGTRCGALDPGVLLYLQTNMGLSAEAMSELLYEKSGLKGLSGISNDVKTLLGSADPKAGFALDYFAYKTAQQIAAMAVTIGGLDGLVFTGGIGENAEPVRANILARLNCLGPFEVHVIPANEERVMAIEIYDRFVKLTA